MVEDVLQVMHMSFENLDNRGACRRLDVPLSLPFEESSMLPSMILGCCWAILTRLYTASKLILY